MFIRWPWQESLPTVVHITHHKAGSEWVRGILQHLFGSRLEPRLGSANFVRNSTEQPKRRTDAELFLNHQSFQHGRVYPGFCLTRDEFLTREDFAGARRFIVIRDPRDTLVSHYYSVKDTHKPDRNGVILTEREKLRSSSKDEGLMYLFETLTPRTTSIQKSWFRDDEIVVRYEDLIANDLVEFEKLLLGKLKLPVSLRRLKKAVEACRFEKVFKRKLGELDQNSHGRQGLPGDWKNHFSPELRQKFHERYGELLIAEGYETSESLCSLEK